MGIMQLDRAVAGRWYSQSILGSTTVLSFNSQVACACKESGVQGCSQSNTSHLLFFALWHLLIGSFIYSRHVYWTPVYGVSGRILGSMDTAENKTKSLPSDCVQCGVRTSWCASQAGTLEKLANHHSLSAVRIAPLPELDVGRKVTVEDGREN